MNGLKVWVQVNTFKNVLTFVFLIQSFSIVFRMFWYCYMSEMSDPVIRHAADALLCICAMCGI